MEFIFKARDNSGKVQAGKVEAISQQSAIELLQKNNLTPISVERKEQGSKLEKQFRQALERPSQKELAIFFQELATLVDAKVPFASALTAIESQMDNKYFRIILREIKNDIEDGMPLSDSLSKHTDVFNTLTISMIRSGEVSGNLQKAVSFLAGNIEKNYRLVSKIRGALIYPAFVIGTALVIGFLAITVILPKLTSVIKEMDIVIPWYTKIIMAVGDFMQAYWWAVLIGFFGVIGAFIYYIKTEAGKKEWDQIVLKMPVVGELMRNVYMARFAENFSVLMTGGIPIVKSLNIVSDIMGNSVYKAVLLRAADEVKSGGNISSVFERSSEVPAIVTRMVKVGEETGKMNEILDKVADFYEKEADRMTSNLTALIEPALIVVLGIGVAILAFGILLPIYDIAGKL
jgi:type IV pilus assembly protein PilC